MSLKYLISVFILLILLAIVGKRLKWFGQEEGLKVSVETIGFRDITQQITANGKIEPETEVKISPDVSGEIVELLVKEGDYVEENQLLLRIKPDTYKSMLDRMKASLNSSKANLANALARHEQTVAQTNLEKATFQRNEQLFEQKTISIADYQTSKTNLQVRKAELKASTENVNGLRFQITSAEASLTEAKENLKKTDIYAPMSGTISRQYIEKGERVVGTAQMAGTELLRIANLKRMQLKVNVNENDILKVHINDTANIEIDAYRDQTFKGLVTEIANSALFTSNSADQVTNFEVKILLLPESYQHLINELQSSPFRPGMSATADILTETQHHVLAVPIQAVTTRPDTIKGKNKQEIREVVFGAQENKAILYFVKTGIQDNDYIQIISGLTDSLQVITAPYRSLTKVIKDGQLIEITDQKELYNKK